MLNIKNIVCGTIVVLLSTAGFAQKGTQSPYSSFGLGERNYEGFSVFSSMGGVALGNTDSSYVNSNNPASYAYLGRNLPILQLGMNGRFSEFSTTNSSSNQRHFGLNQFQLGLPIGDNWGAAIALKPYSFTGYRITNYVVTDGDTTNQFVNEGSGGVRIATMGVSYRPVNIYRKDSITFKFKDKNDSLYYKKAIGGRVQRASFGINANYLFGTSEQIRSAEFVPSTSSTFNARVIDGLRVSGLTLEAGLNYQFGFESSGFTRLFSVGATFSPETQVRAFQDLYSFSYLGSFYRGQSVIVLDTIQFIADNEGVINKPQELGFGFEYRYSPLSSNSFLRIGLDVKMEKWSTFYSDFSSNQDTPVNGGLKDRLSVGLGLDWMPAAGSSQFDRETPFLSRIHYRFGLNYSQTELLLTDNLGNEVGLENYGMSFGLGIPIKPGTSNTNINFGGSLGTLGTTTNGLIKERYVGLYVGISITPQRSAKWFLKRKYD